MNYDYYKLEKEELEKEMDKITNLDKLREKSEKLSWLKNKLAEYETASNPYDAIVEENCRSLE